MSHNEYTLNKIKEAQEFLTEVTQIINLIDGAQILPLEEDQDYNDVTFTVNNKLRVSVREIYKTNRLEFNISTYGYTIDNTKNIDLYKFSSVGRNTKGITVNRTRTPEQIARDVQNRLIKEGFEWLQNAIGEYMKHRNAAYKSLMYHNRIKRTMNQKEINLDKTQLPYEYSTSFYSGISIKARNSDTWGELKITSLTPEQTEQVVKFLMQFDPDINAWPYPPLEVLYKNAHPWERWREVNERIYWDQLECLPPARHNPPAFMVGEPWKHEIHDGKEYPVYAAYTEIDGRYFAKYDMVKNFDLFAYKKQIEMQFKLNEVKEEVKS